MLAERGFPRGSSNTVVRAESVLEARRGFPVNQQNPVAHAGAPRGFRLPSERRTFIWRGRERKFGQIEGSTHEKKWRRGIDRKRDVIEKRREREKWGEMSFWVGIIV